MSTSADERAAIVAAVAGEMNDREIIDAIPSSAIPSEPDPEWDEFTKHVRDCLSCKRLGRMGTHDDLPLVCATADKILDEILTPYSIAVEESDEYQALCLVMEDAEVSDA